MATAARKQPPWQPPPSPRLGVQLPPLKVYNSLTRSKEPFIPLDPEGKEVTWYACGPTVYDDAHLGHARNYVSTDILRRILTDYFKFKLNFVMNITDVDDKIILRGRQQHLLQQYKDKHPGIDSEVVELTTQAYMAYLKKNLPLLDLETSPEQFGELSTAKYGGVLQGGSLEGDAKPGDKEAKIKMHLKTASSAAQALSDPSHSRFYELNQDVLLPYLDSLYGSSIDASDHTIFTKLTKHYEDRFMKDMHDLNVLKADTITRVTEYGTYIAEFTDKILRNGYAYQTSDGSIYFDIQAFEKDKNYYARLEPWNRNDKSLQADGEGALIQKTTEKRSDADFALWKASKPGEPAWTSPWGNGRPGWHIECSAMASERLGREIDIHSGGIDLAFPHHDNELAQSEAYWNERGHEKKQWVNYFLHMGHLSIQGSKMSKSLKNFTTIRDALERGEWSPRSLRIVFLLGGWKEGVEITDDLVKAGNAWEDKVNNFFINVKDQLVRNQRDETNGITSDLKQAQLKDNADTLPIALKQAQDAVFDALCDSFNTPISMAVISELITKFNSEDKANVRIQNADEIALWITSMVNVFGLSGQGKYPDAIGWHGIDVDESVKPYVYYTSSIRDVVRQAARSKASLTTSTIKDTVTKAGEAPQPPTNPLASAAYTVQKDFLSTLTTLTDSPALPKEVLSLCDKIRDTDLWDLGIYLEDRDGLPALVRIVTRDLRQARDDKAEKSAQRQAEKEAKEAEQKAKADKGRLSHVDMFRTEEFSAWDQDGIPVKDKDGNEINKSRGKKLRKDWERQKKAHEAWRGVNGN